VARTRSGLYVRYRVLRRRAWRWLDRHPRVDAVLRSSGALSTRDGAIPRGVAVGLFVALMPFFGIQTLIVIAGCILVRGNFPAGLVTSWINNPFTVAPLYLTYNAIGDYLFSPIFGPAVDLSGLEREVALEAMYLGAGALCVAAPAATLGYFLTAVAERRLRSRRTTRRQA